MRVEEILEDLEDLIKEAWTLPLTGGKGVVNLARVNELINEIRDEFPNELRQAKAIIADRSQIIREAKDESATIIASAEKKAKLMIDRDEIVKQAQKNAEEIILEAKIKSKEIKHAANEYVENMIKRTDETLTDAVSELRRTRQNLKNNS